MKYFRPEEDPGARLPPNFISGFLEVRLYHLNPYGPTTPVPIPRESDADNDKQRTGSQLMSIDWYSFFLLRMLSSLPVYVECIFERAVIRQTIEYLPSHVYSVVSNRKANLFFIMYFFHSF